MLYFRPNLTKTVHLEWSAYYPSSEGNERWISVLHG